MSLKPLQPLGNPLGQYDVLDTVLTVIKGGEVVTLAEVTNTSATDLAAADVFDGYATAGKRIVVTNVIGSGAGPLFLADDGVAGYGTMLGTVVGGTAGQVTGAALGPHTSTGSGKVTLWMGGLFAVSLDAVDTTPSTGLVVGGTNAVAGHALYVTAAGKLTPTVGSAVDSRAVGRFVEFVDSGSLVNTPDYLIGGTRTMTHAVIVFSPPV